MKEIKRCLFVTDVSIGSPYQGNKERTREMLAYLHEKGYTIDIWNVGFGYLERRSFLKSFPGIKIIRSEEISLMKFYLKGSKLVKFLKTIFGLSGYSNSGVKVAYNNVQIDFELYTLIWVNYAKNMAFLPTGISPMIFCDTHDAFGTRKPVKDVTDDFKSLSAEEEISFLNRADVVVAIQPHEENYFKSVIDKRVKVVRHMSEQQFIQCDNLNRGRLKLGYIGSDNPNNINSLISFIEACDEFEVNFELFVAGTICDHIPNRSFIKFLGEVKDLYDFYTKIDCTVNPMIGGSGLKIKTIESYRYNRLVYGLLDGFSGMEAIINSDFIGKDNVELISKLMGLDPVIVRGNKQISPRNIYEAITSMNTLKLYL